MRPDIKVWNPEKYLQPDPRLLRLVLGPVSRSEIKRNRLFSHPQPALLACCYGGSFRRYAAYSVDLLTPDSRYQNSSYTLNGLTVNPVFLLGIRRPAS